jgi:cytochrome c553
MIGSPRYWTSLSVLLYAGQMGTCRLIMHGIAMGRLAALAIPAAGCSRPRLRLPAFQDHCDAAVLIITLHVPFVRGRKTMRLRTRIWNILAAAMFLVATPAALAQTAKIGKNTIERGKYLSIVGGCNDCHSPKMMTPNGPTTDPARILSGHPATERLPSVPPGVLGPGKWMAMTNDGLTAWVGPWGISFACHGAAAHAA